VTGALLVLVLSQLQTTAACGRNTHFPSSPIHAVVKVEQRGKAGARRVLVDLELRNGGKAPARLAWWLVPNPPYISSSVFRLYAGDGSPLGCIGKHYHRAPPRRPQDFLTLGPGERRVMTGVDITDSYALPPNDETITIKYEVLTGNDFTKALVVESPCVALAYRGPTGAHDRSPVVEVDQTVGSGAGVVEVSFSAGDGLWPQGKVRIEGLGGTRAEVETDGRWHSMKVSSSYPRAARFAIGKEQVFAVIRDKRSLFLTSDPCAGWAPLSDDTDPRSGKAPQVICQETRTACPPGFVKAGDGPLHLDTRCPDPARTNIETMHLCYRPGRVRFQTAVPRKIEIVDTLTEMAQNVPVAPGTLSKPVSLEYERCRPQAVAIDGLRYFFAVGRGEVWLVSIAADGAIAATVQ
jgi:hypothetical protein